MLDMIPFQTISIYFASLQINHQFEFVMFNDFDRHREYKFNNLTVELAIGCVAFNK